MAEYLLTGERVRRAVRSPLNPLDRSTIVSIYPKPIDEQKHTIQPGRFQIDPGTFDKPSILIVGSSSWWKEVDEHQPLLEIPNSSLQVANSIVVDYCKGLLAVTLDKAQPGIFWMPGEFNVEQVKKSHHNLMLKAKAMQENWFKALVEIADALWARTGGNPLTISDDMRMAARELNVSAKDWMKDFSLLQMIRCKACGAPRNEEYPVCPSCHAIVDVDKAKALGLSFAKV